MHTPRFVAGDYESFAPDVEEERTISDWSQLWTGAGAKALWQIPDPRVSELARSWRAEGVERVLDLGCGIGRHVTLMAHLGMQVYGSDHAPTAIEATRSDLENRGLDATLWVSELDEVRCPDAHLDAVVAFNSVYHGTRATLDGALNAVHRKLKPGGRLFVTLLSTKSRLFGRGREVEPRTFESEGMFRQLFEDEGERGVPHHFSRFEDLPWLLRGFDVQEVKHEQLRLPSRRSTPDRPAWFSVRGAWFWRVVATRGEERA